MLAVCIKVSSPHLSWVETSLPESLVVPGTQRYLANVSECQGLPIGKRKMSEGGHSIPLKCVHNFACHIQIKNEKCPFILNQLLVF